MVERLGRGEYKCIFSTKFHLLERRKLKGNAEGHFLVIL